MRLAQAWIVSRKDFAEFRANKQILLTLTLMPILMSVVMPLLLSLPLVLLPPGDGELPPDLNLGALQPLAPGTYSGQALVNRTIVGARVENSTVTGSFASDSTFSDVVVVHSLLVNVTVESGLVRDSVLENSTFGTSVVLVDSYVLGADPERARLLEVFGALAVNIPLLFFVIMSVAVPTTLAAYSFVGEKTNRSLEPLLAAPLSDGELLLGKYLSAFVPTMVVLLASWATFTALADVLVMPRLGQPPLPNATWLLGVLVVMPLFSFLGISLNVLISTKVSDVRTAQQYGALIVMPLIFLFSLGGSGVFLLSPSTLLQIAGVLGLADLGVFLLTLKVFRREEILTKWK